VSDVSDVSDVTSPSRIPSLGRRGGGWVGIQFMLIGSLVAAGVRGRGDATDGLQLLAVTLGTILIALGTVIIFQGTRRLRDAVTPMPKPLEGATLVVDGVYAYVRHPIYLGLMLVAFGWSVAMDSLAALVVAIVFAVFLDLKSRREEAWLRAQYPQYVTYAAQTRRFVPYIY
jgi:protein-S-isoprenylcysteine O-methyltransferase Ste14